MNAVKHCNTFLQFLPHEGLKGKRWFRKRDLSKNMHTIYTTITALILLSDLTKKK